MSLKMKLVSCVSAFIIVASLMLISVFATTNVTLNIGGNVTFQAVGVQATISQGVVANGTVADSASKMQAVTIDSENDGAAALATWSGLELSFDEDGAPMTITFDITNNHIERDLEVSITNNIGTASNATMSVTSTSDDPITAIVIPANTSGVANSETITITFSVQDPDLSASIEGFTVGVAMTSAEREPTYYDVTLSGIDYYAVGENIDSFTFTKVTNNTISVEEGNRLLVVKNLYYGDTFSSDVYYNVPDVNEIWYSSDNSGLGGGGVTITSEASVKAGPPQENQEWSLLVDNDVIDSVVQQYPEDGSYGYVHALVIINKATTVAISAT